MAKQLTKAGEMVELCATLEAEMNDAWGGVRCSTAFGVGHAPAKRGG